MVTDNLCIGLAAHVDAGKTTLAESVLLDTGAIRKVGRVDHGDSFLDGFPEERRRGITIYSKQALFKLGNKNITLMDTPGHEDFGDELLRVLPVLDYCILIISAPDGVRDYDEKIFNALSRLSVPRFIFINKMDRFSFRADDAVKELKLKLSDSIISFDGFQRDKNGDFILKGDAAEEAALIEEAAMEEYLGTGFLTAKRLAGLTEELKITPCFPGSALKNAGVREFIDALSALTRAKNYPDSLRGRVYKISRDQRGRKVACIKMEGGILRPKDDVYVVNPEDGADSAIKEKADQIYIFNGNNLRQAECAGAGMAAAVSGLQSAVAGSYILADPSIKEGNFTETIPADAFEGNKDAPQKRTAVIPQKTDEGLFYTKLRELGAEFPELAISYDETVKLISISLRGNLQGEVLKGIIRERFGEEVAFGDAKAIYEERMALIFPEEEETEDDVPVTESLSLKEGPAAGKGKKERDFLGAGLKEEEELEAIFKSAQGRNTGKKPGDTLRKNKRLMRETEHLKADMPYVLPDPAEQYLLVDGYNIIFSWDELSELARMNMDAARLALSDILANYQGFRGMTLILVFDAYKVKGGSGSVQKYHNIYIVYTKEAQTADSYIERAVHELKKGRNVTVATSDGMEQAIVFGEGARRMSARELKAEVDKCGEDMYINFIAKAARLENRVNICYNPEDT